MLRGGLMFLSDLARLPEPYNQWLKAPFHQVFQAYYSLRARARRTRGTAPGSHSPPVYVTLTTYPKRFGAVHMCIESLLSQTARPDKVILYVGHPVDTLPRKVVRLQRFGLQIRVVEDVGPLTKIVHAIREHPEAILVTADDDNIYPHWWLGALLDSHMEYPGLIHCHRATAFTFTETGEIAPYEKWNYDAAGIGPKPSMLLLPTGVSGVLYPPRSLHPEVLDIGLYRKLTPTNDDLWLKIMSMRVGTNCRLIAGRSRDFYIVPATQRQALWHHNESGANRIQMQALLEHFQLTDFFSATNPAQSSQAVEPA